MACHTVVVNGFAAIVCGVRERRKKCSAAGCSRHGELLCDWKIGDGKTCDKPICPGHALHVGDDKDLCLDHREAYRQWLARRGA